MGDARLPFVPAPGEPPDWPALDAAFDWIRAMRGVPQNPVYHAEGDVWVHTRLVLEALTALEAWQRLDEPDRSLVCWAALLHDAAKPACTRIEPDGRITSRNHARVGARMARERLWQGIPTPVPFVLREQIVHLVRLHGLPLWLLDKPDPRRTVLAASQVTPLHLLALLAEADVRGRICEDRDDLLERVALFRSYAQELGCYEQPYPFADGLSRYVYFHTAHGSPDYVPYDDTWGVVTLLSGLPGAGKDTWVREQGGAEPVIALDAIRAELGVDPRGNQGRVVQTARERARVFLRQQQPFVWNATNVTRALRTPLVDLVAGYGARVRLVYVEPAYETLFQRNAGRESAVPERVLRKLMRKLEVPTPLEAHDVVYAVST